MLTITLPDDLGTQLQIVAKENGGTIADLVKEAVMRYLTEMEEARQDVDSAQMALEEYERDGGGKPWEQVKQELGLR